MGDPLQTPTKTESDIVTGLMAAEVARFTKKNLDCDRDRERHRNTMNAVGEAQARKCGAAIPEEHSAKTIGPGEDDMDVFTNSPVSTTTNTNTYHYPQNVPSWVFPSVVSLALLAGAGLLGFFGTAGNAPPSPVPAPSPAPPTLAPIPTPAPVPIADDDIHISVTHSKSN